MLSCRKFPVVHRDDRTWFCSGVADTREVWKLSEGTCLLLSTSSMPIHSGMLCNCTLGRKVNVLRMPWMRFAKKGTAWHPNKWIERVTGGLRSST